MTDDPLQAEVRIQRLSKFVTCVVIAALLAGQLAETLAPSIAVLGNDPQHVHAFLVLTVLSWVLKFCGWVSRSIIVLGIALPVLYGLFRLVEDRLIPGPLDDWIAEIYKPWKKYVSKPVVLSMLKWSGVVCMIIGGSLLGSNTYLSPYGFVFLASSSGQYLVASIMMKDKQQIVLFGTMFVLVDCFGIYRWLG